MSRPTLSAARAGVIAIAWGLAAPGAALACSVCIGAESADTRIAYRAMTAFMTFTPLAIVGGVVYWIHRRFKALDAEHEARAGLLAPPSAGPERGR